MLEDQLSSVPVKKQKIYLRNIKFEHNSKNKNRPFNYTLEDIFIKRKITKQKIGDDSGLINERNVYKTFIESDLFKRILKMFDDKSGTEVLKTFFNSFGEDNH